MLLDVHYTLSRPYRYHRHSPECGDFTPCDSWQDRRIAPHETRYGPRLSCAAILMTKRLPYFGASILGACPLECFASSAGCFFALSVAPLRSPFPSRRSRRLPCSGSALLSLASRGRCGRAGPPGGSWAAPSLISTSPSQLTRPLPWSCIFHGTVSPGEPPPYRVCVSGV